jgi:hypothetical protein
MPLRCRSGAACCRLNIGRLIGAIIGIEWHEVMQEIAQ